MGATGKLAKVERCFQGAGEQHKPVRQLISTRVESRARQLSRVFLQATARNGLHQSWASEAQQIVATISSLERFSGVLMLAVFPCLHLVLNGSLLPWSSPLVVCL